MAIGEWSREDLILAVEFYHNCPERMHTDSHARCEEMARILGRSPGALDRIIRNIKFVDTGNIGLSNASEKIRNLIREFHQNQQGILDEAAQIRRDRNMPPLDCGVN